MRWVLYELLIFVNTVSAVKRSHSSLTQAVAWLQLTSPSAFGMDEFLGTTCCLLVARSSPPDDPTSVVIRGADRSSDSHQASTINPHSMNSVSPNIKRHQTSSAR